MHLVTLRSIIFSPFQKLICVVFKHLAMEIGLVLQCSSIQEEVEAAIRTSQLFWLS